MRKYLVAGNWKLNGSRESNSRLIAGITAALDAGVNCEVMVCPPFVYLDSVGAALRGSAVLLGAQNIAVESSGAFTGEVSGGMLRDIGCSHVIVGHSERRTLYGETDELVAEKFVAAQSAGLVPVLCVGETQAQREEGITEKVVSSQVRAVISRAGIHALADAVLAYEPVWAIGTGLTATPEQAEEVHASIRAIVAAADARIAAELRILYGGSVKGSNALDLFAKDNIDGGLIGGASLNAADFAAICQAASGNE